MMIRVLRDDDISGLIRRSDLMREISRCLERLRNSDVQAPARTVVPADPATLEVMPAYDATTALGVKLIAHSDRNVALGLPLHRAVIMLFDPSTGAPLTLLNAERLTAERTAAVTAVSTDALAPAGASRLLIVGAGMQAATHLRYAELAGHFGDISIYARRPEAGALMAGLHPQVRVVDDLAAAVSTADVVWCCTSTSEPVIADEWVTPDTHISSVAIGPEVGPRTVARATLFAESRAAVLEPFPSGASEYAGENPASIHEIGGVLDGSDHWRRSTNEITYFKSVGHALFDLAAASLVWDAAKAQQLGDEIEL